MITIITCFYQIDSKYPVSKYLKWIKNFMDFKFNRVIYCDQHSYHYIFDKYPKDLNTIYRIIEFENFITNKYSWEEEVLKDNEKKYHNHTAKLYQIWIEKIYFVKRIITENPFNSKYFMWLDIGSFRYRSKPAVLNTFPDYRKFIDHKIILAQIYPFDQEITKNIDEIDSRFNGKHYLGGLFAGDGFTLLLFEQKISELLEIFKKKGIFAGNDQTLYNYVALQNPNLVYIIDANTVHPTYNPWFCFHYYFS